MSKKEHKYLIDGVEVSKEKFWSEALAASGHFPTLEIHFPEADFNAYEFGSPPLPKGGATAVKIKTALKKEWPGISNSELEARFRIQYEKYTNQGSPANGGGILGAIDAVKSRFTDLPETKELKKLLQEEIKRALEAGAHQDKNQARCALGLLDKMKFKESKEFATNGENEH